MQEEGKKSINNLSVLNNNDEETLQDLLSKYKIGQRILTYYEKNNQLHEHFRNKLCDIIISDIENKNAKYVSKH